MAARIFRYDKETDSVVETVRETVQGIPRYPLPCEALAVHPSQIAEFTATDRAHGVPTEYRPDGTPIMRDAGHYRRYRRLHGFHFNNGFES